MIITKTPFRMSFFGGGTDFEEFYKVHGGAVLSTTFNKFCYVNVRHLPGYFDYKTHLTYSRAEYVNSIEEIKHPAIREAMRMLDMHDIRLIYDSDLPAKSGLGTSSSFAVGMLNAFYALKGKYADKKRLAEEAVYLERVLCREAGGIQDQIAAAYGGMNRIEFTKEGFLVKPVIISPVRKKELNDRLLLFFTGFSRYSAGIQEETKSAIKTKEKQLLEMLSYVDQAEMILTDKNRNLDEFGELLHKSWMLKQGLSDAVTNQTINHWYEAGLEAGALGGKILGAGGGGFLLFYVPREFHGRIKESLKELLWIPFQFEDSGTRVIHYTPEDYEPGGYGCMQ